MKERMTFVYGPGSIFANVSQALAHAALIGCANPEVISVEMWERRQRRRGQDSK